jgi:enediyne biosynthesis protein E4
VNTAVGYLSASDKRVLAGLGNDALAKLIEIRWPSGVVQKFENVKSQQYLKAVEPPQ